jgi:hypothetical protein
VVEGVVVVAVVDFAVTRERLEQCCLARRLA